MKVILLKDVPKVGRKYQIVNVSDGHAANMLFPRKLAEPATPAKVAALAKQQKAAEQATEMHTAQLESMVKQLDGTVVTLTAKANEKGHLYKAIQIDEVLAAIQEEKKVQLPKEVLDMSAHIKETGEHALPLSAGKVRAILQLKVEGDK
jgi:large subunit ribosomal protein L9